MEFKLITLKFITVNYFGAIAAIIDFCINAISQLFEELQSWNSEFKLINPKPITGTNFETNLSRFGLAGLPLVTILDFQMVLSELFNELKAEIWN